MDFFKIKKIFFVIILFFLFPFNFSYGANINTAPKDVLKNGLVGWWTMDGKDMLNGAVRDKSGNGNTGNLVNIATSTFYTAGKMGQGFRFDGSNDRVTVNNSLLGTASITISVWVNPNTYTGNGVIYVDGSTRLSMVVTFNTVRFSCDGVVTQPKPANNSVPLKKWTHVAVVRGDLNSNTVNFYINGVLSGSANQSCGTIGAGSNPNYIGDSGSGAAVFNGIIDDVRVYNRVLSASEIQKLYNQGAGGRVATTIKGVASTGLNAGLVGWWTMDGKKTSWTTSTAGTTLDSSGNSLTGTLVSMNIATSTSAGKVGQAFKFNGLTNQITVADNNLLSFGNSTTDTPFTIGAWVRRTGIGRSNAIVSKTGTTAISTPFEYAFYINSSNQLVAAIYDGSGTNQETLTSDSTFEADANKWTHYLVTYSGNSSNSGLTLYRNGVAIPATGLSQGVYVAMTNSTQLLRIGNAFSSDPVNKMPMSGFIDDLHIYNRALSASEVQKLYNQGAGDKVNTTPKGVSAKGLNAGLVGWWTFDGKDMLNGAVVDKSGNGNTGNLVNIATSTFYTQGKLGQGFRFDGVDDYVALPNNTFDSHQTGTVSAWIKLSSKNNSGTGRNIIGQGNTSNANRTMTIGIWGVSASNTRLWVYSSISSPDEGVYGNTNLAIDRWYHVAINSNGSAWTLYINGVSESLTIHAGGNTGAWFGDNADGNTDLNKIGAFQGTGAVFNFFSGQIDDVRVYNRALSASEIKQLYNLGR